MRQANTFLLVKSLLLFICLVVISTFVFYQPYNAVKQSTIDSLNAQQLVLARQASLAIRTYFQYYERMLLHLGRDANIADLDEGGKILLDQFYQTNKDELSAVTRVDSRGIIIHTSPYNENVIGKDISMQSHNAFIIEKQEQVVSDVFTAVQGYQTVAYAVPVFADGQYAGSLTVLIPFTNISQKYLANIVLGEEGYAWLLDKSGVELYCPVPGHIGKTIYETSSQFPSVIEMAEKMMKGEEGVTVYSYDRIKDKQTQTILKHAVYYPIELPNNTWSIVVATPEHQALAAISEFGKWWLGIFGVLVIGIVACISFFIRSKYVTRERVQQQETEERIKESERLFHSILSSAHIPIIMINVDGVIEFVNNKCTELYGYSQGDIPTTRHWFERAYPDPSLRERLETSWKQEIEEAVRNNDAGAFSPFELPIVCKNGEVKDVFFDFTFLEERVIVTLSDCTEQNNLEKERKKLVERETRAKKMEVIGLMAGGVAHDLNNILSGIVSYPDILLSQLPEDSALQGPLRTIKESGSRAAMVVEDLLTAARGAATIRELHDLTVLVNEYLQSPEQLRLSDLYPEVSYQLVNEAVEAHVMCSPVHVKKSLMNLVTNGVEAIEGKGTITISIHNQYLDAAAALERNLRPGNYVILGIEDTGAGISDDDKEHIFEPFYTKKKMGRSGSGLGLVIVWNSVMDHDGTIEVKSDTSGTKFDIYLPLSNQEESERQEESAQENLSGKGEHILVVDDEPILRDIACQILRNTNYIVDVVSSGEEAIAYLKNKKVDLVLLDMFMEPGLNGRETYEQILAICPGQKAIIISGYSESEDVKKTIALGSGNFLKKPYTSEKLQQVVQEELSRKKKVTH